METAILPPFFLHLLVTAAIGLIIGLEREFNTHSERAHVGGIRTFTLVAILGYLSGTVAVNSVMWVIPFTILGFFLLLSVIYYYQIRQERYGLTTELSMLSTLLLGIFVSQGYVQESLAVVVVMTALLSVKEQVHGIVKKITEEEMFAFIKFAVLALLILPILPDKSFGPGGLINSLELGWLVIIVLSISFTGYLLLKFVGRRGILLTALIGGLFSSTMVTWVFSERSREKPELSASYGAGIILASSVMFIRALALAAVFYQPVARFLAVPLGVLLILNLAIAWRVYRLQKHDGETPSLNPGNPLDIRNAAVFTLVYTGITFGMYYARQWSGHLGAYISGAVSGIADIDAITISSAKWASADTGQTEFAASVIILAILSNTVFKAVLSYVRGSAELGKAVVSGFGIILVAGLTWLFWWSNV
ncbi:MAG: MgtC/SapB family protein [Bacteroidota bacterium]